ncbi:MAG: EscU/YscU/HrcU family type III secretion system export apparatus switch protein [Bryobacteraceae bacterium]|nr:EscU/YscU/HrcU family type III secretion system export apparatus switch protein [Bryobacteraceae bacterium]
MADKDQRTESPTPQRIRKAREDGRFPASREMVFAVQFLGWTLLLSSSGFWMEPALHAFASLLRAAFHPDRAIGMLGTLPHSAAAGWIGAGAFCMLAIAMMGLISHLAITEFGFAPAKAAPDFSRLNPAGHLRELPRRNLDQLVAAVVMLPLLFAVLWMAVRNRWEEFLRLPLLPLERAAAAVGGAAADLLWKAALLFLAWGAFDLLRQRHRYFRDLRMTRQEVREEYRQNEGSPEIKARIRRLRRELLRRRMMAEVAKATAVVVNPTHYAVALRYDRQTMAAPRVVAKGRNYLAQKIREKALAHQVPVIENPPLARALYRQVEVGQEIPVELYRAVAEVLAYVYRLMQGGGAGGR